MDVRRRASVRHDGPFEDDALAVERTPSEGSAACEGLGSPRSIVSESAKSSATGISASTAFSTREALASLRQMASLLPAVGDETGGRASAPPWRSARC